MMRFIVRLLKFVLMYHYADGKEVTYQMDLLSKRVVNYLQLTLGVIAFASLLVFLQPRNVTASHSTITSSDNYYEPYGTWNGFKVYLSSPRHLDSGSRGECGWEENLNGRYFNDYAARGWYYWEQYDNTSSYRNLRGRGYKVAVSANARDDGHLTNRESSNNWGADVHLVTHTNALNGCKLSTGDYLRIDYKKNDQNSIDITNSLRDRLDSQVPGGFYSGEPVLWAELNAHATYKAYVELFFHDNEDAVKWFEGNSAYGEGRKYAWRYGFAIDKVLGYPR